MILQFKYLVKYHHQQTVYKMKGDKLIQKQKWDGKKTKITRYVENNLLIIVSLDN